MKPNFALSLSLEGVRLLLRAAGGWRLVGEVMPSTSGFEDELAVMRKTATALAPDGLRCKLVIPNEQIRYLTIQTPGMTPLERRDAARQALDGATPYTVDDLAFDVSEDGDATHIAAVAYETLDEAEAFAETHRFHPVSFVAIPGDNTYLGEPFFGPSKAARTLLTTGQVVEPDGVSIVVIGEAEVPSSKSAAEPVETTPASVTSPHIELADETSLQVGPAEFVGSDGFADKPVFDVADPGLPPRDVISQTAAFASRRKPRETAAKDVLVLTAEPEPNERPITPRPEEMTRGFAEPPVSAPNQRFSEPPTEVLTRGFAETAAPPLVAPKARSVRVPPVLEKAKKTAPQSDMERLTVFGAREQKPRQGAPLYVAFLLTVALLVFLAGIAAWASGYVQDGLAGLFDRSGRASIETEAVQVSPPTLQPAPADVPAALDTATGSVEEASLSDEDAAVLDALRTPLNEDPDDAASPRDEDARASYAVTGIWPQAPQVPQPPALVDIEDLYVTSIDPIEPAFDAVALPPVSDTQSDLMFDDPGSPAAAGTKFSLDNRGLVVPSAQGTLSPDGIEVFAGAPPSRPDAIPERGAPAVEVDPAIALLAGFRPRQRPGDLQETTERATLDGLTRAELAQFRPPIRPISEVETAAAAAAASLVPLSDGATPLAEQDTQSGQASDELAVTASLRPDARPSNFNQIVARAQKTASSAATVGAASIAPRTVTPKIPSSASVTREATVRNAINLRKVNLIGVYGTPSDRRALVRLANGRYKKVQVGDRIDGGRISAIGDSELRYQKSGRNLVLRMPKG
ncbi:hypothetical protein ACOTTU_01630 [Roseobacter sp. EG26]|uniref:hypothetical protein n=1 Tax=Roseobacter sp. EG26 TaxID=3412477 RepID=UPI003CE535BD